MTYNLFYTSCLYDLQGEKTPYIKNRPWIGMARLEDCDAGWRVTLNMSFPPTTKSQQTDPAAMAYPVRTGMPSKERGRLVGDVDCSNKPPQIVQKMTKGDPRGAQGPHPRGTQGGPSVYKWCGVVQGGVELECCAV